MNRQKALFWGNRVILSIFYTQILYYLFQLTQGKKQLFEVLSPFLLTMILIFLFKGRFKKSMVLIQGILGMGIMVELFMLVTLLVGMFIFMHRLEMFYVGMENMILIMTLLISMGWKSLLMISCFLFPELIIPKPC